LFTGKYCSLTASHINGYYELSVRRFDHQQTGGDLEGARVPSG